MGLVYGIGWDLRLPLPQQRGPNPTASLHH